MGKKGKWFSAVKKALGSQSKDTRNDPERSSQVDEVMMNQQAASIAIATAKAAEAAMAAAQAASELVRLANAARLPEKPNKEVAAVRIQAAFRAHLARRRMCALRGQARLKTVMQGASVKRQTNNTLKCMQTLARVQSEVRARKARVSEENKTRLRQLIEKHSKEFDELQNIQENGEDWKSSSKSKEQEEARRQSKQKAAMKRDRALAYSFNHQRGWRNSAATKATETLFMDSINPHWGWSWLESWLAARPWETLAAPSKHELAPLRSSSLPTPPGPRVANALLYHVNEKPPSKQRSTKPKPTRRLASVISSDDEESKSLASSSADVGPRYMALTESARARSRAGSLSPSITDRVSVSSAKRRVSYPSSSHVRSIRSYSPSLGDGK